MTIGFIVSDCWPAACGWKLMAEADMLPICETSKFNSFCKGQSRKPTSTILVKDGARALFARFLL